MAVVKQSAPSSSSYWLCRFVLLRLLGLVYLVAFLVAANQNQALIGAHGLTPAPAFMQGMTEQFGSTWHAFWKLPSLFWWGESDGLLNAAAWTGVGLSLLLLCGWANSIGMALLWALYMSIVHIGQDWYGFGWEIQLLETGFLAIFLCPLLDARPFPRTPPPVPVLWLFRWLGFRIMLGAGLIKLRGDACWRDLSCLDYHFETQPIPNPISRTLNFLPHSILHFGVLWNHLVELVCPWFFFAPRRARHLAALLAISFQLFLMVSGNLSFLNWLTIIPFLACIDDSLWRRVLPARLVVRAEQAALEAVPARGQQYVTWGVVALVAILSINPVTNLLSSNQAMNTSFDPFELVNTYGAFGSVGKERQELVLEGTSDGHAWQEYEFKAKPGDPSRRPPFISPYHLRLDWLMWFAAMGDPDEYPWIYHLVWKLLHNDAGTLSLMAGNPFPDGPPQQIRALLYRYTFAHPDEGRWWNRTLLGEWLPPMSVSDPRLLQALQANGWDH